MHRAAPGRRDRPLFSPGKLTRLTGIAKHPAMATAFPSLAPAGQTHTEHPPLRAVTRGTHNLPVAQAARWAFFLVCPVYERSSGGHRSRLAPWPGAWWRRRMTGDARHWVGERRRHRGRRVPVLEVADGDDHGARACVALPADGGSALRCPPRGLGPSGTTERSLAVAGRGLCPGEGPACAALAVMLVREFRQVLVLEPGHQLWRGAAAWCGDPGAHRSAAGGT